MNEKTKGELLSALYTFIAAFLGSLVVVFNSPLGISWELSFWIPVILSAIRVGVKAVLTSRFSPSVLGGRKV